MLLGIAFTSFATVITTRNRPSQLSLAHLRFSSRSRFPGVSIQGARPVGSKESYIVTPFETVMPSFQSVSTTVFPSSERADQLHRVFRPFAPYRLKHSAKPSFAAILCSQELAKVRNSLITAFTAAA